MRAFWEIKRKKRCGGGGGGGGGTYINEEYDQNFRQNGGS